MSLFLFCALTSQTLSLCVWVRVLARAGNRRPWAVLFFMDVLLLLNTAGIVGVVLALLLVPWSLRT